MTPGTSRVCLRRPVVAGHALVEMVVQPDAALVAAEIQPGMLQRSVFEDQFRADGTQCPVFQTAAATGSAASRARRHDIRIEHDKDRAACKTRAGIAGTRVAAVAVHDHQLHRQPVQKVQAAQQVLRLVLDFR